MLKRIGDWWLEEELNRTEEPLVVLFTRSGGQHSGELRHEVQALARNYFLTRFFVVDLVENPGLEGRFGIPRVPVLIVFVGGAERVRHAGADPRAAVRLALGHEPATEPDTSAGADD